MAPATKNFLMAVGVGIVAGLAVQFILKMVMKKKTDASGTTTSKLLGLVDIDGVLAPFDGE
jgi:asparagine N-glycosylation enzyme membrane subunit Stt3